MTLDVGTRRDRMGCNLLLLSIYLSNSHILTHLDWGYRDHIIVTLCGKHSFLHVKLQVSHSLVACLVIVWKLQVAWSYSLNELQCCGWCYSGSREVEELTRRLMIKGLQLCIGGRSYAHKGFCYQDAREGWRMRIKWKWLGSWSL